MGDPTNDAIGNAANSATGSAANGTVNGAADSRRKSRKKREIRPITWVIDDEYDFNEEQDKDPGKVKIKGDKHPAVKDKYWTPDEAYRIGEIRLRKHVDEDDARQQTEEWIRKHEDAEHGKAGKTGGSTTGDTGTPDTTGATGATGTANGGTGGAGDADSAGSSVKGTGGKNSATANAGKDGKNSKGGKGGKSKDDNDKPPMFVVVKGKKGAKDTYYPVYDYDPKFHLFRRKMGWVRTNPVIDEEAVKAARRARQRAEQKRRAEESAAAGVASAGAMGAGVAGEDVTNGVSTHSDAAGKSANSAINVADTHSSAATPDGDMTGDAVTPADDASDTSTGAVTVAITDATTVTLQPGFIKVTRVRLWPIILLFLIILAVIWGILSMSTGVAPQDLPRYIGNQTGITHPSSKPTVSIEYATYESTPDTTWQAGSTEQSIHLVLPGGVSYTDSDGNQVSGENPVNAAPSVWVDVNGDGDFTLDECVYNCPTYDADGEITDPGALLEPGNEVTTITINRTLEPGEYKARTLWTPRMRVGGDPANPMTFNWNLTVE